MEPWLLALAGLGAGLAIGVWLGWSRRPAGVVDDGQCVWLPIDAKFPREDYERWQQAYEKGDRIEADRQLQCLGQRVLGEAQSIAEKYVAPPHTTDFALLFLPTEGLYAEVLRIPGLEDEMQRKYHVVPSAPQPFTP